MEDPISTLELNWKVREGGQNWSKVEYLDFIVDGQSVMGLVGGDFASCLGWMLPEANDAALRRLLLEEPADLPNNRRSLYLCPECGDLGCGGVTIEITQIADTIVWRSFGYENNYSDWVEFEGYENIGPFTFNAEQYRSILESSRLLSKERAPKSDES